MLTCASEPKRASTKASFWLSLGTMNGGIYTAPSISSELGKAQYLGAFSLPNFIYYFSEGAELTLNIIKYGFQILDI